VPAKILPFARLSDNVDSCNNPSRLVAVRHSLFDAECPADPVLFFALGDLQDNDVEVVEATNIEETAFVLPCVQTSGDNFTT
jgi:hypothetical protein